MNSLPDMASIYRMNGGTICFSHEMNYVAYDAHPDMEFGKEC